MLASVQLATGSTLGRYRIDAVLGAGGMGVVYKAHDTELERDVALKVVAAGADPDLVARMRREARAASALSHPNAATVFDVGEVEGRPYIVMELIEGRSLRDLVADDTVSLESKLDALAQIGRALGAAHERGLVHRDVKPDNAMVRADGVTKLLDFGIAKKAVGAIDPSAPTEPNAGALTKTGTSIGSPAYMAPEQIRGKAVDGRTDQFAWAVTAFELLTGELPWKAAGSSLEMAGSILHEEPASIEDLAPDLPRSVTTTITKAMSKRAEDRFENMEALLAAFLGPTSTVVSSSREDRDVAVSKTGPMSTRRPVPWSAIIAGAVIAVLGTVMLRSLLMSREEEAKRTEPRGPILGLDDEATKRAEAEYDMPLPSASTSAAGSASAASSAAAPSAVGGAARRCAKPQDPPCDKGYDPWCDREGKRVTCCVKGLVGTAGGRCECAPGGVTDEALVKSGCAEGSKTWTQEIQTLIRARFDALRTCYEAALKRNKKTQGKVSVSFVIDSLGVPYDVQIAKSSAPDATFQDCLVNEFAALRFGLPPNGSTMVTYPIDFSPGE